MFDVIVIGAGVAGSAAAYDLAQSKRVLLLEQFGFLHAEGSSHGGSRIFRQVYEDARYVRMAVAADVGWRALERDADDRLLYRSGGLDFSTDPEGIAPLHAALSRVGRPYEVLSAEEVGKRFPAFRVAGQALYQADGGVLAASRCVAALQRLAYRRGAVLAEREAVQAVDVHADRVTVKTATARYEAGALVVTAGGWLRRLAAQLGLTLPLVVEQQQALYLRTSVGEPHDLSRMPTFIDRDTYSYGLPSLERPTTVKVGAHTGAPTIDIDERTSELEPAFAQKAIRGARDILPGVTGELAYFETCLYTKTPDEHPILDRHPDYAHVVLGGGFSGHGFKFGPLLGELLGQLVRGEAPAHDLSLFRVTRFAKEPLAT